jgi:rod shape-determining protein MreC
VSFRDGPFNDLKVPLTWTAAVAVIVAVVVGVALLLSDRRETLQTAAYGAGRKMFDVADKPVAGVLSEPSHWGRIVSESVGDYLFAAQENRKLHQQVAELKQWRDLAIALQDTNRRYQAVLGLKTDPPIPMITGRVVLDSRGPFANTRLADVGLEKGVRVGNPVMSDRGLVGRVVGVANDASRVLLLTDVASRTPVLVARTDARAILLGDGGSNPRLGYLRGQDPVHEGDRILTSGDGGVFPRGLPVGVAAKGLDGQWRVRLDADLTAIDFVRILEFQDFTDLVDEKQLEKSALPPLPPGTVVEPPPSSSEPASSSAPASVAPAPPEAAKPAAAKGKAKPEVHKPRLGGLASKLAALFPGAKPASAPPKPQVKPAAAPASKPPATAAPAASSAPASPATPKTGAKTAAKHPPAHKPKPASQGVEPPL